MTITAYRCQGRLCLDPQPGAEEVKIVLLPPVQAKRSGAGHTLLYWDSALYGQTLEQTQGKGWWKLADAVEC